MMFTKLNIVIPAYNEAENIRKTLYQIKKDVRTDHEIFVVYDFDEDNSVPVVKDFMKEEANTHIVRNSYGAGAANAIRTGFEVVDSGVLLVVMADLSDDLAGVDEMFKAINRGYDIVCGSRYMKGGEQLGGPKLKKFLSRAAGVSLYHFIGLPTHDVTNSFKMYTKEVLDDIEIVSNSGFELGMEIVIKAFMKGYKITEVPITWQDRRAGDSRFKLWKWLPRYMYWYLFAMKQSFFNKEL